MSLLNANVLFASLIWGSIGVGYFIYGKKRPSVYCAIGGIILIALSYVIGSALWMSILSIGVLAGVHWLIHRDA